MDRKKGFISIVTIIVMSILLAMSLHLVTISGMEHLILSAGNKKTQSYYQAEDKIYLALCDDKYYSNQLNKHLIDFFRSEKLNTKAKKILINENDLNFGDRNKDVFLEFVYDKDDKVNMNLLATSDIKGISSLVKSSGPVVNELFENGDGILSFDLVEKNQVENLGKLLEKINEDISSHNSYEIQADLLMELKEINQVKLNKKSNKCYEITSKRNSMVNSMSQGFIKDKIFIIARGKEDEKLEFILGNAEDFESNIVLEGIIFVEGNLIISNNFDFKGIIIIKNGDLINEFKKECNIEGLLIMDKIRDYDDFIKKNTIIKSRYFIYKYGTYLPGFLDPKITLIKGT